LGAAGVPEPPAPVDPEGVPLDEALELLLLLPEAGAHALLLLSSNPAYTHGVVSELI
jgi:hypothetical protein